MAKLNIKAWTPNRIVNFFAKGQKRSIEAKRNILASFIYKGLGILLNLALVPITISYVNTTNYGIWLTLSSIISWFTVVDIGFGNGLRNKFAEAKSQGNHELARIYVSTTYAILSIIISVVFIIFFIMNFFIDWSRILNTDSQTAHSLSIVAMVVFTFFCLTFIFQLISNIIVADQKPAIVWLINLMGNILSFIIIIILKQTTEGNLLYLVIATGVSPVLVLIISNIWFFKRDYARYKPSLSYVRFTYAKNLMNLGIQFFIIQCTSIIILTTSNLIISQLFSPKDVTVYNVALRYMSMTILVFYIIIGPFWSAFTEAYFKSDHKWIKNAMKNLFLIWSSISIMTIIMILVADKVYYIWLGKEVLVPRQITIFTGLYAIILNWNNMFGHFLNGIGKIRLQVYNSVLVSILYIPIALYLGREIGIHGVIIGTCLILLSTSFLSPLQYFKIVGGTAKGIWGR